MALNFPSSPTNGQKYEEYAYDSVKGAWISEIAESSKVFTSSTPPVNPKANDLWMNIDEGITYTYHVDVDSSQWVQVIPNYTFAESLEDRITTAESDIDTLQTAALNLNSRTNTLEEKIYSPNYIINGAFDIWQRGISVGASAGGRVFSADRWNHWRGQVDATSTYSRQPSGLTGFTYALRVARNSGSTGTSEIVTDYDLESQHMVGLIGKIVTLSFYVRAGSGYSSANSILTTKLISGTGINGRGYDGLSGATNVINTNITLANTWQRFTFTGTVPLSSNQLAIQIAYTPTGTAGTNDYFEITGVQLEEGSTATPFRRNANSLQGELAACQRYYQRIRSSDTNGVFGSGIGGASGVVIALVPFVNTMRVPPGSVEWANVGVWDTYALPSVTAISIRTDLTTDRNIGLALSASGITQYRPYYFLASATNGYFAFSAEL